MRGVGSALLLLLLLAPAPAAAAEPVARTFAAKVERVWSVTESVLKHLGWEIDKSDRTIGWITTESRRVEGEDYGVYEKATRHRLTIHVKAVGADRTTVSIERAVFRRERILWMDNDEPVTVTDRSVEQAVLAAIGKSL